MKELPKQIFASVTERDVDLLILEELRSSSSFRQWWLRQGGYDRPREHDLHGAWHSLSGVVESVVGESDLVFLVASGDGGERCAVMIENKIYASAQPDQAARYRARGQDGVAKGLWDRCIICITAWQSYLDTSSEASLYDAQVSHESIRSWFEASALSRERANHKMALLTAAIERSRRGYAKEEIPIVTSFFRGYWQIAHAEFPDLPMPRNPPRGGRKSQWVRFSPPAPGRRLVHKLQEGYVDLELNAQATNLEQLASANREILDGAVELCAATRSAAFRVTVAKVDHLGVAADQRDEIRAGLAAARRLLTLSPQIRVR